MYRRKVTKTRKTRQKRIRQKISGTGDRPRLNVFRSNRHIYAQVINDEKGTTLASFSDFKLSSQARKGKKIKVAEEVGKKLGEKMKKAKISQVTFDRSGYRYHGRVKALAEGVREAGIKF